jgi:nucleoside-diphosphate-sugar epimerase
MKVFVTGATGFIGFAAAQAIRRAGHDVLGLVRSPAKSKLLSQNEIHSIPGDLKQPETYKRIAEECHAVVHAAMDYKADQVAVDKLTIQTLLECCEQGPRPKIFVFTSGVWIYGETSGRIAHETSPLSPPANVAWRPSHERMVLQASNARGIVLRPGCVYGKQGSLTADWFDGAVKHKDLKIVGDGKNHWAMVHLDDLGDLYLRAIESDLQSEIFNATDESRPTVQEMVEAVVRITKYTGGVHHLPVTGAYEQCLALDQQVDSSKAQRILGWQPRHRGFIDGIESYYEAWKGYQ